MTCCRDLVEPSPGVWLPRECTSTSYTSQEEPPDRRGIAFQLDRIQVNELHVNDIPDSMFDFEFPAGTLVADAKTNKAYYMPEGIEMLDDAIAKAVPFVDGKVLVEPGRVVVPPNRNWRYWLLLGLNVAALVTLIAALWYRRKRQGRRSS